MEIIGVIAEYNPFHNGHLYHINEIKKLYKNSIIIGVISSSITQRGDISLINKWDKADIALSMGIDIVVELPYPFSSQNANIFAYGALSILNYLKVDKIVFGSEENNCDKLYEIAKLTTNNIKYEELIKKYMDDGLNYPTSSSKATYDMTNYKVENPNDILGLCYIKEIIKNNYNIKAISIKRTNNYNDMNTSGNISSATSIRNLIRNNLDISEYVPNIVNDKIYKDNKIYDNYFNMLKYKILSDKDLSIYQTVDEGIENKIKKSALISSSLDELIENTKSRRYTYNRLKRTFSHILMNFTKEDANRFKNIEYIRILGFNNEGKTYLKTIKNDIEIPIITNFINNDMLNFEKKVTDIYSLIVMDNSLSDKEFKNKPIIK